MPKFTVKEILYQQYTTENVEAESKEELLRQLENQEIVFSLNEEKRECINVKYIVEEA